MAYSLTPPRFIEVPVPSQESERTCTVLAPVFAHTYCTCQKCKIIGKVKMETTGMWGLTLIILKYIKCFQI